MGDLSVIVRLHGVVVENRVIDVAPVARLGEAPSADVPFPGANLTVTRTAVGFQIRGRTLSEGESITIRLGKIEVHLEHTGRPPLPAGSTVPHEWRGSFDSRFLVVLVLVAVSATWMDAFEYWAARHLPHLERFPIVESIAHHVSPGRSEGTAVDASQASTVVRSEARPFPDQPAEPSDDGPLHRPDDQSTHVGWYRWYRSEVPTDVEQVDAAVAAHLQDPYNPDARALLGRAAYDADNYPAAAQQYGFIVEHHPEDPTARLRLAQAEMRRGHHRTEIAQYQAVLRRSPEDIAARAGLAVALTRLERLDEASIPIDELRLEHPEHPLTRMAEAKLAALAGRDDDALEHLDEVMHERATLSAEWQLEVRRDIALDPAFARLRKDVRLRGVVNRHLGAAGPRPLR